MNVEEYICSLPTHIAAPGIFQGRIVLEVQDPATVQHILNMFNVNKHRELIVHFKRITLESLFYCILLAQRLGK